MTVSRVAIGILALSFAHQVLGDAAWDIKVRDGDVSCDLIAYNIDGTDDSFGFFTVGFYILAETESVPGYELPKGKPILLIRIGPEPGKSSSYMKPDAVVVNGNATSKYQWDEGNEWDSEFFFIAGATATNLFELSRKQEPLSVKLVSEQSDDRTVSVSTDKETSFPILAEMLMACGHALSKPAR